MSVFKSIARWLNPSAGTAKTVRTEAALRLTLLEDRFVPATLEFRTFDGAGNNLTHTQWGSTDEQLLRVALASYGDGISTPAGANRPSARVVSNVISDQGSADITSNRMLSAMVYAWGQFIDHDLGLTDTNKVEKLAIPVPTGDPYFDPISTGTKTINTTRSQYDPTTGTSTANPRQQTSQLTSWMDASMVYGVDATTAASLRTMSGGLMKTSANGLLPVDSSGNFVTGDSRANENVELTSLHTLFVREHNRLAAKIASANPKLSDESIYQQARAIVIAEVQAITFNEWLPAVLGTNAVSRYAGYNPNSNPTLANEFSTAAFRFGHSLLGDDVQFLDNNGNAVRDAVTLSQAFFNPSLIKDNGIDPVLKYLASDPASELDTKIVNSVRNFLFGAPGSGGLDLASLNIERGRDHGLADYNTTRAAYGLPRVKSFADITTNTTTQAELKQLYGTVDNIDLWVGTLAEDHLAGASVGITLRTIIVDQFTRIRDGDRFWYQRTFQGQQLDDLQHLSIADVISRNSTVQVLQPDVLFLHGNTVSGVAFNDANRNGKQDGKETVLAGVHIFADLNKNGKQDGNEPGMTTAADGSYSFLVPKDGGVVIVAVSGTGYRPTTINPAFVSINPHQSSGVAVDFGFSTVLPQKPINGGPGSPPRQGFVLSVAPPQTTPPTITQPGQNDPRGSASNPRTTPQVPPPMTMASKSRKPDALSKFNETPLQALLTKQPFAFENGIFVG